MEEPELEEGEACYKDDASIDPDVALSYIDEKLQSVLGHFQKDFEGGVSAENLGAKFGGYGSFLPTFQRSPSIWSQPKTPHRAQSHNTPRSSNTFPEEGVPQNSTAPSNAPPSLQHEPTSHSMHESNISTKQDSTLSLVRASKKSGDNNRHSLSKSVNQTDQRTLKVRIKVGSSRSSAQHIAAIYSGLGLMSPSSSTGNSLEESDGVPVEYEETLDESPACILQVMTSFPVLGDALLSPLHDRLLALVKKRIALPHNKPSSAISGKQDGLASLKKKKTKALGNNKKVLEGSKHDDDDNNSTSFSYKNQKYETRENKPCLPDDFLLEAPSNSKGSMTANLAPKRHEKDVPMKKRELNKDLVKDVKIVDSIENHPSKPNVSVDIKENGRNDDKKAPSFKDKSDVDVLEARRESNMGAKDHSSERDEMRMPQNRKKTSFEGKGKLNGSQNKVPKERESRRRVFDDTRLENSSDGNDQLETHSGERAKEQNASVDKSKERLGCKNVDNGLNADMEVVPMVHVAPEVIEEHWVACDRCQKWRLLPYGTMPEQLPENWLCSMLNWLPGLNRCDISEQETTDALHALYQLPLPLPDNQNNLQNRGDGAASQVNSTIMQHFNQHHVNIASSSSLTPNLGKRKHKSKSTPVTDSKSLNDTNQPCLETNFMNKSNAQHVMKPFNFDVNKDSGKQKEKQLNGGNKRQKNLIIDGEFNHGGHEIMKKSKTDSGDLHRVDLSSSNALSTKVSGRYTEKHSQNCSPADSKNSSKERLLNTRKERGMPSKKRKTKDWMVNTNENHLLNRDLYTKEEKESEFLKEKKKLKVSDTEGKGRVTKIILSGNNNKDQSTRSKALQRASDDVDALKRDLGLASEQFSMAAASSSSKVSDSRKTKSKSNFQEAKGSPVESVSSSPLRVSIQDKSLPPSSLRKGETKHDSFGMKKSSRKSMEGANNVIVPPQKPEKVSSSRSKDKDRGVKRLHDSLEMKSGKRVTPQHNPDQDFEHEATRSSNLTQVESRGGISQAEQNRFVKKDLGSVNGNGLGVQHSNAGAVGNVNVTKSLKLQGKTAHQNGDNGAPNQAKRDGNQIASNALKEAEDLKHYADRIKNSGFDFESNEAYLQAALKFLHGASLLENCNTETSKQGEITQMQIYCDTAKLCEMCAVKYEKSQEMAAASLAYKCMEVAYMRVVYCKYSSTNRDRHDLQASLQMASQGESPSSSASDVDNFNNHAAVEKATLPKGTVSHGGSHVIVTRNRPNFVRLLDFTKDVNSAMEASKKSQTAFAAANLMPEMAQNKEAIASLKRVIDFSFQDMEELVRLVRLAIDAINRREFGGNSRL